MSSISVGVRLESCRPARRFWRAPRARRVGKVDLRHHARDPVFRRFTGGSPRWRTFASISFTSVPVESPASPTRPRTPRASAHRAARRRVDRRARVGEETSRRRLRAIRRPSVSDHPPPRAHLSPARPHGVQERRAPLRGPVPPLRPDGPSREELPETPRVHQMRHEWPRREILRHEAEDRQGEGAREVRRGVPPMRRPRPRRPRVFRRRVRLPHLRRTTQGVRMPEEPSLFGEHDQVQAPRGD